MKTVLRNSTFDSKEHHLMKYQYKNVITHLALPFSFSLWFFYIFFLLQQKYKHKTRKRERERPTDGGRGTGPVGWWGGGVNLFNLFHK